MQDTRIPLIAKALIPAIGEDAAWKFRVLCDVGWLVFHYTSTNKHTYDMLAPHGRLARRSSTGQDFRVDILLTYGRLVNLVKQRNEAIL